MSESVLECRFRNNQIPCEYLFQDIITEEGLCFTFNSLTYDEMFNNGHVKHEFHSFDSSTSLYSYRSNVVVNSDELRGIPGHWTMEDGFENIANDTENMIYPFRVLTYAIFFFSMWLLFAAPANSNYIFLLFKPI